MRQGGPDGGRAHAASDASHAAIAASHAPFAAALRAGQVFTPAPLADAVWARALDALGARTGAHVRAAEPAAGDGALLGAGLRAAAARGLSVSLSAAELDADLVAAARRAAPSAVVVHADALTLARGAAAPPSAAGLAAAAMSPAEVAAAAPNLTACGWADVVVANPPYLRETGHRDVFHALRTWHGGAHTDLYRKDADLHFFFWGVAARWLRPGGVLAFLTPAYFLESEAAAPLRAMLERGGEVVGVWRAGPGAAFSGIGVEAAVTVWRRGEAPLEAPARPRSAPAAAAAQDAPLTLPRFDDPTHAAPAARVTLTDRHIGDPWWLHAAPAFSADAFGATVPLGALYRVVEGVSTGADRLRARDVSTVAGGVAGEGILVLRADEVARLGLPVDGSLLARRFPTWTGDFVLRIRDRALPRLDAGEPPTTPLEHHLLRFRAVLEARAEVRRNKRRSWYATLWPRPELDTPGALVTPKWSPVARFSALPTDAVPMTDHRVLLPRTEAVAASAASIRAWLNSDTLRPWTDARLKRKGAQREWYGAALAAVPVPWEGLEPG